MIVEHSVVVYRTAKTSIVRPLHARRLLRRLPPELRRNALRNDHLLLVAMGLEFPIAASGNSSTHS